MLRTLAAENMEHDSTKERFRALLIILGLPVRLVICRILTQEFILEEAKLKNEAMSKTILTMQDKIDSDCNEISNLEKLIKSQVRDHLFWRHENIDILGK